MPRIPNVTSLPQRKISGRQGVTTIDTSHVGKGFKEIGNALREVSDDISRYQLSKADADMQILLQTQRTAFDNDEDFGTIDERWSQSVDEGSGEIFSKIANPQVREAFVQKYRPVIEENRGRIRSLAFGKEREYNRRDIKEQLRGLSESAMGGDMSIPASIANNLLTDATRLNYLTPEEQGEWSHKWKTDTAVRNLDMIASNDPEAAVAAVQEDWAKKNLPIDTRVQLEQKYREQSTAGETQAVVDGLLDSGTSISGGRKAIQKMYSSQRDVHKRDEALRRFNNDFNARRSEQELVRQTIMDQFVPQILGGTLTVDAIRNDPEMSASFDQLDSARVQNLYRLEGNKASPKTVSDPAVLQTLSDYYFVYKDPRAARKYVDRYGASLKASDLKSWQERISEALGTDPDSGFTDTQMINSRYPDPGDTVKRRELTGKLGEWSIEYQKRFTKPPSDEEKMKALSTFEKEYDSSWFWGGTKKAFQMDSADWEYVLSEAEEDDPDLFETVNDLFRQKGFEPTPAEFMEAYTVFENAN